MSAHNINIEELLKELDPATLQALEQLLAEDAPAVRKTIQNILDEPISEKVEKSLNKPLIPKKFQPIAPPRKRRRKTQEILRKFDPITRDNIRNVTNCQNEILDLYDTAEYEGEEEERGRRYIRWRFIRELERDLTSDFMSKIREKVHTSSTQDIFLVISYKTLKKERLLFITLTKAHHGLIIFLMRRNG